MRPRTRWFGPPVIRSVRPASDVIAPGGTTLLGVECSGWGWVGVEWPAGDGAPLPTTSGFLGASGVVTLPVPVDRPVTVRVRNLFGSAQRVLRVEPTLSGAPRRAAALRAVRFTQASPFPMLKGVRARGLGRATNLAAGAQAGIHRPRVSVPRVSRPTLAAPAGRPAPDHRPVIDTGLASPSSPSSQDVPE